MWILDHNHWSHGVSRKVYPILPRWHYASWSVHWQSCLYLQCRRKCNGMLTPERLSILRKAFDRAKCNGLHDHFQPPPISFASKLVGLTARKDTSAFKHTNKKIKDYFARILPSHITVAFQKWALVTREEMASPLNHDPKFDSPITGVSTQGTKCLGQTPTPSPPDSLGSPFAIPFIMKTTCMLLATRHAIYSAAVSTEETATFMLLPSWN